MGDIIEISNEDIELLNQKNELEENLQIRLEILEALNLRKSKPLLIDEAIESFVDLLKNRLHIYTWKDDDVPEVWVYSEGVYNKNGVTTIREEVRKILGSTYSEYLFNKIIERIKPDTYIVPEEFIKKSLNHEYEVNVLNGIVKINPIDFSIQLIPHTPNKIFLYKINAKFNSKATCEVFDKFLDDTLADATDKATAYEALGVGLAPNLITKKAVIAYGEPDTGKTTFTNTINEFYSKENCSNLSLKQVTEDKFSISDLFGKIANIAGDLSQDELKNIEQFKTLTGGDYQEGDRKYKTHIRFQNLAKFFFNLNNLPRVYNADKAFWNRLITFKYIRIFIDKDVYEQKSEEEKKLFGIKDSEMGKKLITPQELSGLLNKALEGLIRFYKNKKFSYSKGTDEVSKEWIMLSDSFMAFCLEFIELADTTSLFLCDTEITRKDLASQYHQYCIKHKVKGVGDKGVRATLNAQFGVYTEGYTTTHGTNERTWQGIRWKKTSQVSQPFTTLLPILEVKKKYIKTCETSEETPSLLIKDDIKPSLLIKDDDKPIQSVQSVQSINPTNPITPNKQTLLRTFLSTKTKNLPSDLILEKHIPNTPIPKNNREVQFYESKECADIVSKLTTEEVYEFLKNNEGITSFEAYDKMGLGFFKFLHILMTDKKIRMTEETEGGGRLYLCHP